MADIVNLRSFRKRKARAESASKADENRIRYGRTLNEKLAHKTESSLASARLDGHRRKRPASSPDSDDE